jgi:hypothetical protein
MNSKGRCRKPFVVIALILDHKDGHYVRPNKVALKYPNFKKDVDPNAHDSQPLKVENHLDFLACRWRATYHWKEI